MSRDKWFLLAAWNGIKGDLALAAVGLILCFGQAIIWPIKDQGRSEQSPHLQTRRTTAEAYLPKFESEFIVPIVVAISSGIPVPMPNNPHDGKPDFLIWAGSREEKRQEAFSNIGFIGYAKSKLVLDKPHSDEREQYRLELIEFAFLREIEGPGSIGNRVARTIGPNSVVRSGTGQQSPIKKPETRLSSDVLKHFKANRFAVAFAPFESQSHWFVPPRTDFQCGPISQEKGKIRGRLIAIENPGIFSARITVFPQAGAPEALPSGLSLSDVPRSKVETWFYRVKLQYAFKKYPATDKSIHEFRDWLDLIFKNIRTHYGD